GLLVHVPIAQGGRVIYQPQSGWILPYRTDEICLDSGSRFDIVSNIPSPVTGMQPTNRIEARAVGAFSLAGAAELTAMLGNIFTVPVDLATFQREMANADEKRVVINGVWIRQRESAAACVR